MLVAIDYDRTYTRDPELFEIIIKLFKYAGHEPIIVTSRRESEQVAVKSCFVYYTGYQAKDQWCKKNGLQVDIWIDDDPRYILQSHANCDSSVDWPY